jgi:hypothetical protein
MSALRYADNFNTKDDSKHETERVYKKDDELPDCLRYALMTWPELPKVQVQTEKPRDLTKLDPEIKKAIERMRRLDKADKPQTSQTVGDFWQ